MSAEHKAALVAALFPAMQEIISEEDAETLRLARLVLTSSGRLIVERFDGPIPPNLHSVVYEQSVLVDHPAFSTATNLKDLLTQIITGLGVHIAEALTGGDPGDIIYFDEHGFGTRLAIGTDDQVLAVDPTTLFPIWVDNIAASGRYRQFTLISDGLGGFDFIDDGFGTPVTTLEDLEP